MTEFFAPSGGRSLQEQLIRRIAYSLLIAFLVGMAAILATYQMSDARSRRVQEMELSSHFQSRIVKLDSELMVHADVLRGQLEFNRLMEVADPSHHRVTAYLNSIGGQQIFTQVHIFSSAKRPIFGYSTRSEQMSLAPGVQGKEGLDWVYDPQTQNLYRSVEQKIWMGSYGSGWLLLYVPMDNTLLQSITFPGTTLRLQRDGSVLTTTDTDSRLPPHDGALEILVPWGADAGRPELVVTKTYVPPLPLTETMVIVSLTILCTLLLSTALIARWIGQLVTRLRHLGDAAVLFGKDHNANTPIRAHLALAKSTQLDEVGGLAKSMEAMMGDVQKSSAELLNSEQKFASIFRHSPIALALTRVEDDVCVDVNDAWVALFARASADVVGRAMSALNLYQDTGLRSKLKADIADRASISGLEARLQTARGVRFAMLSLDRVSIAGAEFLIEGFDDITERRATEEKLRDSQANILRLNAGLEERVRRRTAQLESANKELEAFSYSVSHDLRSPLNTIDGFSSLLQKLNVAGALGEKGSHYLARIRSSTHQMAELITGLLSLAKLARDPLNMRAVDVSAIATRIAEEMRERNPSRQVQVNIQPDMTAWGDSLLLSAVLQNLLGNAWKFTSKLPQARIDFGNEVSPDGKTIFFLRDNGAGFDMAHAARLFGTFERLHQPSEFPGTGIGLAIVHRVVLRHHGRVWAKAMPGEGATFYFSLGEADVNPTSG